MTGKVIAIANMKGGVGKTATVVGLAEALAAFDDAKVLVIDLDPQASASMCLAGDGPLASLIRHGRTIDAFLHDYFFEKRTIKFDNCIHPNISKVCHVEEPLKIALLASSPKLRNFERDFIFKLTRQKFSLDEIVNRLWNLMRDELKRSKRSFDYVVIDCPPGISVLTECSIRLADLVMVPTIPDSLSTFGLQAFCHSLWTGELAKDSSLRKPKSHPRVLITRRKQTREQNRISELLRNEKSSDKPAFALFNIEIPERAAIAEAIGKIDEWPTFSKRWGDEVLDVLNQLQQEVREVLHGA